MSIGTRTSGARAAVGHRFLRACRGLAVDRVPVWFMRQAGRSLPEYRALRARHSILELCTIPELAAEATLQPVRRLGVDAAILFSDIVVPLRGMGVDLEIREGVGPVVADPIRTRADIARLRPLEPDADVGFVADAIRVLLPELTVPLIGFAGAPFTLACYLVEGGPSRDKARTKALMYSEPAAWNALLDRLADATLAHLGAQIEAGAAAVQLFDSWVGALSPEDFRARVLPATSRVLRGLGGLGAPRIVFGLGAGELLAHLPDAGADVVGVDWRVALDAARGRVGDGVSLQGNLDPACLLAPWDVLERKALAVLRAGGGRGHVFNLGHGVLPDTDPDTLRRLVELVHSWDPRA